MDDVIKPSECSKPVEVYFYSSQTKWKICGNDFYVSSWHVETCYNLVLHLIDFCIVTYIPFSVNKSNFHFKGKCRISIDNKINLSILQVNIRNLRKFSLANLGCSYELNWNNLRKNEVIIQTFLKIRRLSFFIGENKRKTITRK